MLHVGTAVRFKKGVGHNFYHGFTKFSLMF